MDTFLNLKRIFITPSKKIPLITVLLAFASMMYEYCLSHIMTILYGSLVSQYIITTGLFIFFLGVGAIFFEFKLKNHTKFKIYQIEFVLSFLGSLCVIFPFFIDSIFIETPLVSKYLCWALISLIAFCSGIELPALMSLADKKLSVLGFDYLGMCLAGILFPILFLPVLGLLQSSLVIAFVNFIVAIFLYYSFHPKKIFRISWIILIPISLFIYSGAIQGFIEGAFLGTE